jgi:hypothetical protein
MILAEVAGNLSGIEVRFICSMFEHAAHVSDYGMRSRGLDESVKWRRHFAHKNKTGLLASREINYASRWGFFGFLTR